MKKSFNKKFSCFASSVCIFLIHLPFVFAKSVPVPKNQPVKTISKDAASATPGSENAYPNSEVSIYDSLQLKTLDLSRQAYKEALQGYSRLRAMGKLSNDSVISIIDFTLPSDKKRLFIIDLKNCKVLFNTYVAHGRNSGGEYATRFSNNPSSNKSSLGFYVTGNTYFGEHGYSLRLEGEERGINNNAYRRAIVMHCADYMNEDYINEKGMPGRSFGCPAIPEDNYKSIIEEIKDGSCLFIYSPDHYYVTHSRFLRHAS
ncbi:MAG TPA: murein L,D-transpeptidase catalytic domain family protein [Chitinophagaceae bacterium]|nr:murein L,D-transpeptidase catalytic domain family protein [Chitinophagaceae bacterium]